MPGVTALGVPDGATIRFQTQHRNRSRTPFSVAPPPVSLARQPLYSRGALFAVALSAIEVAGCGAATQSRVPAAPDIRVGSELAKEQTLIRSIDSVPRTIDPSLMTDVSSFPIGDDLFEGLTTIGPDGRAVPGVAESWETSADGRTWIFHLRPNARWSNGEPVTAGDFRYAWQREVDPHTAAEYADSLSLIEHASEIIAGKLPASSLGVTVVDAHTLRVQLAVPAPYLLQLLDQPYFFPLYRPAGERYGDAWVRPEHMVSNGPFHLVEAVLDGRFRLQKNPYYWDAGSVHLGAVTYLPVPEKPVQTLLFRAGDLLFTSSFPTRQYDALRASLGQQVQTAPYFATYGIALSFRRGPFKANPKLRQALTMSIDRSALSKYLKQDVYTPAYSLVPPLPGYEPVVPDWASLPSAQRNAAARELYRQAGYSDAHPLHDVALTTPAQGTDDRHYMEAVTAYWTSVLGARIGLEQPEFKVMLQNAQLHKLELFQYAWDGDYLDPLTFLQLMETGSQLNYSGYSNPDYDALIRAARAEADNQRRYALFRQAEELLNRDVVFIPLFYYATRHLVKPYVSGWRLNVIDRNPSKYMFILQHQGG